MIKNTCPYKHKRDNYDEVAADFLTHYGCAQYLTTPMAVPIFDIARKRMFLTVYTNQQLSDNGDILGTIAFFDGEVDVYDPGTKSYIGFSVKKGTVLVDCTIDNEGRGNNTMAHECVHWHIHRNYFNNLVEKRLTPTLHFAVQPESLTVTMPLVMKREWKNRHAVSPRES